MELLEKTVSGFKRFTIFAKGPSFMSDGVLTTSLYLLHEFMGKYFEHKYIKYKNIINFERVKFEVFTLISYLNRK